MSEHCPECGWPVRWTEFEEYYCSECDWAWEHTLEDRVAWGEVEEMGSE